MLAARRDGPATATGARGVVAAVLGRLALVVASLAFVLLVLDGVFRIAVPQWPWLVPQRFLTATPDGVLAGVPDFRGRVASLFGDFDVPVTLDARGFRNPPGADPAAPLAFVGDSFCFGWGLPLEQSFPALAAARLGRPYYNFCTVAADLADELQIVRTRMPPGRRTTVLTVTFENDVLAYPEGAGEGGPTDAVRGLSRSPVSRWLMTHSAVFNVGTTLARQNATIVALVHRLGLVSGVPAVAGHGVDPIAASVRLVGRIARAAGDGPFVVVTVPPRPGQVELVDYDAFVAALAQAGFDVIDPHAAPAVAITTIPHDGHWDAATDAAIAARLAAHLTRAGAP